MVAHPTASAAFIATQLPPNCHPSLTTIKDRLRCEFGLKSYRPAKKPALSPKNIQDRLNFCRRYKHWTCEDWSKVLFSDETSVKQFATYFPRVRRPPRTRFVARYTVPVVKHSPTVMIWGCMSAAGVGSLWFMPKDSTINSAVYLKILQEHLPTQMARLNCDVLQQDGAPSHSARSVKVWLQAEGVRLLEKWPGSSPDLNPIERCWAELKKKVSKLRPTSEADLVSKIQKVWRENITVRYCRKLVHSMPERISKILRAKGGHIRG